MKVQFPSSKVLQMLLDNFLCRVCRKDIGTIFLTQLLTNNLAIQTFADKDRVITRLISRNEDQVLLERFKQLKFLGEVSCSQSIRGKGRETFFSNIQQFTLPRSELMTSSALKLRAKSINKLVDTFAKNKQRISISIISKLRAIGNQNLQGRMINNIKITRKHTSVLRTESLRESPARARTVSGSCSKKIFSIKFIVMHQHRKRLG